MFIDFTNVQTIACSDLMTGDPASLKVPYPQAWQAAPSKYSFFPHAHCVWTSGIGPVRRCTDRTVNTLVVGHILVFQAHECGITEGVTIFVGITCIVGKSVWTWNTHVVLNMVVFGTWSYHTMGIWSGFIVSCIVGASCRTFGAHVVHHMLVNTAKTVGVNKRVCITCWSGASHTWGAYSINNLVVFYTWNKVTGGVV